MPTFTAVALERLLESGVRNSTSSLKKETNSNNKDGYDVNKKPMHIFISPSLYTTPEPMPIPHSSSTSVSPSPYVFNRKRRDFRPPEAVNRLHGFEVQQKLEEERVLDGDSGDSVDVLVNQMGELCPNIPFVEIEKGDKGEELVEDDASVAAFFDHLDSMSIAHCNEVVDQNQLAENHTSMASQSEFYDADEDFFSDGFISYASPSLDSNIETELHSTRLNLFGEIQRKRTAEDALSQMHNQWQRISNLLSQAGLSFPPVWTARNNMQLPLDSAEQLCQEVIFARSVSEAIGRGQGRAEAEGAVSVVIKFKDQEITQLQDRLQYYETVNYEMSHRNQEEMEMTRRLRQRRKPLQQWIWGSIGLFLTVGTSILAYSYLPQASKFFSLNSTDFSDISSSQSESV